MKNTTLIHIKQELSLIFMLLSTLILLSTQLRIGNMLKGVYIKINHSITKQRLQISLIICISIIALKILCNVLYKTNSRDQNKITVIKNNIRKIIGFIGFLWIFLGKANIFLTTFANIADYALYLALNRDLQLRYEYDAKDDVYNN